MLKVPVKIIICFLFSLTALSFSDEKSQLIFFDNNFKSALTASKKQHKPLFVYIGTEHCEECMKMKKVFNDTSITAYYNANFICLKLNPDLFANNMRITEWGIYKTPSFVYMNNKKYILYSMSGVQSVQELLNAGKKVIKNIREF